MQKHGRKQQGVTLLEILLVIVILSALFMIFVGYMQQRTEDIRRSRVTLQMEQILNAGLAYYVNEGAWPITDPDSKITGLDQLKNKKYLPSAFSNNAWGRPFVVANKIDSDKIVIPDYTNLFYIYTDAISYSNAQIIAGKLPLAFVTNKSGAEKNPPDSCNNKKTIDPTCTYVVTMVNIPGRNLNNANAVTFTNIYHANGCVPAPQCPAGMKPSIMVIPVSISGVNDKNTDPNNAPVYPIESFTAFAKGNAYAIGDKIGEPGKYNEIATCQNDTPSPCYESKDPTQKIVDSSKRYWRVCAKVVTEKGAIWDNNDEWGRYINLLAITRCRIPEKTPFGEYSGSDFTVWK